MTCVTPVSYTRTINSTLLLLFLYSTSHSHSFLLLKYLFFLLLPLFRYLFLNRHCDYYTIKQFLSIVDRRRDDQHDEKKKEERRKGREEESTYTYDCITATKVSITIIIIVSVLKYLKK